jgi:hypothetical protein
VNQDGFTRPAFGDIENRVNASGVRDVHSGALRERKRFRQPMNIFFIGYRLFGVGAGD